jgi:integrase
MSKPLTAAAVEKTRPSKDRREIPDGGCRGLYLVVQPSGAKSWALRFRRPSGKPAKLVLGSVYAAAPKEPDTAPVIGGHLTLAAAHRLVTELRHQIAQGRDPAATHLAEKQHRRVAALEAAENTFATAAKDWIEQDAMKNTRRWKEQARLLGFQPFTLTFIPKGLAERWAERPVVEIDRHDIYNIVDETRRLGAPGLKRRSDGPTESRARAMLSCLSTMFDWLIRKRRVITNPCAGVPRPETPRARDRVLSKDEIIKFWTAAGDAAEPFNAALKLLLLTGCRLNEVCGMRHDELREDGAVWEIPGSRTKNHKPHVVPLPLLARDILASVPRIEGSPLVMTTTGKVPLSGWSQIKNRLDEAMGNPPHWQLHDLRRTAATGMAELGIPPHIVEAALNHISGAKAGVAGTYNRAAYAEEKKAALERWANHIAGLVEGRPANVTPIRQAKHSALGIAQ